jgi:hypothetical protein
VHCSTPRLPGGDTVPTRTPRFGTLEEMAAARKRSQVPHHSYALDKPVCDMTQRDFFLARKFDVDGKGFLTEQEQEAAKQALAQGMGRTTIRTTTSTNRRRGSKRLSGVRCRLHGLRTATLSIVA